MATITFSPLDLAAASRRAGPALASSREPARVVEQAELMALYRRFFPVIRARCARMLDGAEAEDVAQDTFIRLWRSGLPSTDPRQVTAWIYRTSTRAAIDRLRQRRRREGLHGRAAPDGEEGGAGAEAALVARRELARMAGAVPEAELEVAIMSRLDHMTQPEIAAVLSLSERTVRRMLDRFDARVAALVKEADG